MEQILVSVLCITYNQKEYIAQTIESIVEQKTSFNYELIIHDDCSTDGTQEILRKLKAQYPQKIKLLLEEENKYSKGEEIIDKYMLPVASGKYFAFCEGDDYWIDDRKLQKQVDFLENNTEYVACTHNTLRINCFNKIKKNDYLYYTKDDMEYMFSDVVEGMRWHTSSLVVRREIYSVKPKFMQLRGKYTGGDYLTNIKISLQGKIYKMRDVMSVYRYGAKNSWTVRNYENSTRYINILMNQNEILKAIPSEYKLTEKEMAALINRINNNQFDLYVFKGEYKKLKAHPYSDIYSKSKFGQKIKIFIKQHFEFVYKYYRKQRGKMK